MEKNIILAGVGGQGILSIAFCLCNAALKKGLNFKQSEVHGMSQRGGAVESHVRVSSGQVHSDMVPIGKADVVLSVEPLEVLRYAHFLAPKGVLTTSTSPFENIPNYPSLDSLLEQASSFPQYVLVDSKHLANIAGSGYAENMVVMGAAATDMGFDVAEFDPFIAMLFKKKSERIVDINRRATRLGALAADLFRRHVGDGMDARAALKAIEEASDESLTQQAEQLNPIAV